MNTTIRPSGDQLSSRSILIWRVVQTVLWLIGATIVFCLLFYQTLGIHLFWNILIPVAPILLVVAVGLWRNICPLASTALFPRHMSLSKRKKLSVNQIGILNLIAVVALFIVVPLRHAIFDMNGVATALLLIGFASIAFILGFFFEWKSVWCSGLCPVHPVEKLYGLNSKLNLPNAHCDQCHKCVTPCPDSTPHIHPLSSKKTVFHRLSGNLFVGGFPGFVWGWFQVRDYALATSLEQWIDIYKLPFLGLAVTLVLFLILKNMVKETPLIKVYGFAAVSCYYWFRIPALFGHGIYPGDGMLVDLSQSISASSLMIVTSLIIAFMFWWMVISNRSKRSWSIRPEYADGVAVS